MVLSPNRYRTAGPGVALTTAFNPFHAARLIKTAAARMAAFIFRDIGLS